MGRNEKSSHSVSGASGREGSRPQAFRLEAPPLRFVGGASAFYASAQVTVNFFSTLGPREDLQRVLAHHLSFRCAAWPVILAPRRKGRAFSGMPMWRRSVGKLVVAQSVKYLCSGPMKHQKIGECQDSPSVDKNVSGLVRASDRYLSPAADDCCTGFLGPTDIQSLVTAQISRHCGDTRLPDLATCWQPRGISRLLPPASPQLSIVLAPADLIARRRTQSHSPAIGCLHITGRGGRDRRQEIEDAT